MSYQARFENYKGTPIKLFGAAAVNPPKIQVLLEELEISYDYTHIDIFKGEQFTHPELTKLTPNHKVPLIVDFDQVDKNGSPLVLYESGAILQYLAQKSGKFLPEFKSDPSENAEVLKWLTWQVASMGPFNGQYIHYTLFEKDDVPAATLRYLKESERIYRVLDQHLATREYVANNQYSIADIAIWGWAVYLPFGIDVPVTNESYPNIRRWLDTLQKRPAVKKILDFITPGLEEEIKVFTEQGKLPFKTLEQVEKDYNDWKQLKN